MADEELIDDQYKFVMSIASGTSSVVEEVVEMSSGRHLAMKRLLPDAPDFKENKAQMKREALIHQEMEHPLIVKFDQFSTNRDHTYILMEHFRSTNLKVQIKSESNKIQLKARHIFEGVCAALAHVHQKGYIHRDIKPDNVLVNRAGEIRLCDFSLSSKQIAGIGKLFAGKLKVIQGTRTYIAPETIQRQQPTIQTDIYSLGIVFFEVLAGRPPFPATTPEELLQKHLRTPPPAASEFNPNVTPEMDKLIFKMLMKNPKERPASAEEIYQELKRIRIFKEDVIDEAAFKAANKENNALAELSDIRLDSRADAKLKEMIETNPDFAKRWEEEKTKKAEEKKLARERQLARIKIVEDDEAKRAKPGSKPAAAAPAPAPVQQPIPQPMAQPAPMPMPMQMPMQAPGYPAGYPGYPQGYPQYPQGQPMMMPGPGMPQYPPQAQMGYPPGMQPPPGYPPQPMPAARPPVPASAPAAPPNPVATQPNPPVKQPVPPTATQRPPAQATPAKPAAPRQVPQPAPKPPVSPDIDYMTDLPDVL